MKCPICKLYFENEYLSKHLITCQRMIRDMASASVPAPAPAPAPAPINVENVTLNINLMFKAPNTLDERSRDTVQFRGTILNHQEPFSMTHGKLKIIAETLCPVITGMCAKCNISLSSSFGVNFVYTGSGLDITISNQRPNEQKEIEFTPANDSTMYKYQSVEPQPPSSVPLSDIAFEDINLLDDINFDDCEVEDFHLNMSLNELFDTYLR